jgi:hypothetical protein
MTNITKPAAEANEANASSSLREASTTSRWAFINSWKVNPQADDRAQAFGTVTTSDASPSARRSTARRKHQAKFKEWSQDRHDG